MNSSQIDTPDSAPVDNLGFVFPGQGSQSIGMLADLAQRHPAIRETFDEASEGASVDLWKLAQEGPQDALDKTENTQPALVAACVAVWRLWREQGGAVPARLAGHSLGEYAAMVAAGVLSLHDAANLVAERGRLMQSAVPAGVGAMAAILGGDEDEIAAVCAEVAEGQVVSPANYNAPGQLVIAGHAEAVQRAIDALADKGVRKAVRLPVSVPSHCSLMREAADKLSARMADIQWHEPRIPVIQNADADVHSSIAHIRAALERQLYMPVRWRKTVEALARGGVTRVAECGPGKVLCGLIKRIDRQLESRAIGDPDVFSATLTEWSQADSAQQTSGENR